MVEKCWRARSSVGAISAAWPPASTTSAMANSATTVLPEPTSPCSSRSIRASPARSRSISASAWRCESVRLKGRASFDFARSFPADRQAVPRPRFRLPRRIASASWLATSSSKASRCQAALAGPKPSTLSGRWTDRSASAKDGQPRAATKIGREPFRQFRQPVDRAADRPVEHFRRKAGGQPIDRLDRRELRRALRRQHVVRVPDLRAHVEPFDVAADDPPGAERKELFQPVRLRLEIHDLNRRVFVGEHDPPRAIETARLFDPLDDPLHRHRAGGRHLVERRAVTPVDRPGWEMEQQIAHQRVAVIRSDGVRDRVRRSAGRRPAAT